MEAISFARGVPSPECLPVAELADCARAAIERDGPIVLSYGPVGGYRPLREWLATRHGVAPERVLVTNGSLQGLSLLAMLLVRGPSRRVVVEAPTYDRPLRLLAGLDAEVVGVPLDGEGLDVAALERVLDSDSSPAFIYTIPTFQNPTGRTLPGDRRRRLVELARERGLLVLEDDPYGLVRFEGEAEPTLFELDRGEHVAYSSSFSKTVAPGTRVGYLILPPALVAPVEALAVSTYLTPGMIGQATVFEFLRRGMLEPNLARVRALLLARRDAMLAALERELPRARWNRPEGGYFLWLDLPEGLTAADLAPQAAAAGVTFVAGTDFFPAGRGGETSLRLAYSFVSPEEVAEGVRRLASACEHAAPAGGRAARAAALPGARSPG